MAQKIIHKRSSVQDRKPTGDQIQYGEILVNYASGDSKAFLSLKKSDDSIVTIHEDQYFEDKIGNAIQGVKVNGTALTPDSAMTVNVIVPTEASISGSGFTKNVGTITGINMNGASKGTSGVVDLGTVITSETQLSTATTGTGNAVTSLSVSGHQITFAKNDTFLTAGDLGNVFTDAEYVSTSKTINFKNSAGTIIDSIDATDFIKDGMVDNVEVGIWSGTPHSGETCLIITFNTDAGKEPIPIPLADIFDPSNYYTSAQTDNVILSAITELIGDAPEDLNTLGEISNAISGDSGFAIHVQEKLDTKADSADTIAGYGITDAKIEGNTVILGTNELSLDDYLPIGSGLDPEGTVSYNGLLRQVENDEVVTAAALAQLNESCGFDPNGHSLLPSGISLTEAILSMKTNVLGIDVPLGSAITYSGVTLSESGESVTDTIQSFFTEFINDEYTVSSSLNDLNTRSNGLDQRVTALENSSTEVEYQGVYDEGTLLGTLKIDGYNNYLYAPIPNVSGQIEEALEDYVPIAISGTNDPISAVSYYGLRNALIEDELVTSKSIIKMNESCGFDQNGNMTLSGYTTLTDAIEDVMDKKADITQIATINGSALTNGGNLIITGGGSSGGGDVNVIEHIKMNGSEIQPDSAKTVNLGTVMTNQKITLYTSKNDSPIYICTSSTIEQSTALVPKDFYSLLDNGYDVEILDVDSEFIYRIDYDDSIYDTAYLRFSNSSTINGRKAVISINAEDRSSTSLQDWHITASTAQFVTANELADKLITLYYKPSVSEYLSNTFIDSSVPQYYKVTKDTILNSTAVIQIVHQGTGHDIKRYHYAEYDGEEFYFRQEGASSIEKLGALWDSSNYLYVEQEGQDYLITEEILPRYNYITSAQAKTQIENYHFITSAQAETQITGKNYITSAAVKTQIESYGYTTNAGTITGINMNGSSKGTSGVVDLGTVVTAQTQLSTATTGTGNVITDLTVSNHQITKNYGMTIPTWATASTKPSYTASEVGAYTSAQTDTAISNSTSGKANTTALTAHTADTTIHLSSGDVQTQVGNAKLFYGTCATSAATVAKEVVCTAFTSADLVKGSIIFVTFDATNTGAVGSLTMSVNGTTAKPIKKVYNYGISNLTNAGELIANETYMFQYDGTNWVCMSLDYNSTYALGNLPEGDNSFIADSNVYRYQLLFQRGGTDANKLTPLNNNDNVTAGTKTMLTGVTFDPFGKIFYWATTTSAATNSALNPSYIYYRYSGASAAYTFNLTGASALTQKQPVYLVVSPQSDGLVKIASSYPIAQSLPQTDDGYWYILLGKALSATALYLSTDHPVYKHNGTEIVELLNPKITAGIEDQISDSVSGKQDDLKYYYEDDLVGAEPNITMAMIAGTVWSSGQTSDFVSGGNGKTTMVGTANMGDKGIQAGTMMVTSSGMASIGVSSKGPDAIMTFDSLSGTRLAEMGIANVNKELRMVGTGYSIDLETSGGTNIKLDAKDGGNIVLTTNNSGKATYNGNEILTKGSETITGVTAGGTNVVSNKVAAIPTASTSAFGVIKTGNFLTNSAGTVSVTTGTNATSVAVGNHTHASYATTSTTTNINNTLSAHTGNTAIHLPTVSASDNGKILMVSGGTWTLVTPVSIYTGSGTPAQNLGNDGDIYLQTS